MIPRRRTRMRRRTLRCANNGRRRRREVTRRQPGGGKKNKGMPKTSTKVDLKQLFETGPSVIAMADAAGEAAGQALVLPNFRPDWKSYRPGDLRQISGESVQSRLSNISPLDVARAWSRNGKYAVIRAWGKRRDGWFLSFGPQDDHNTHIHLMSNGIVNLKGVGTPRPTTHLRALLEYGDNVEQVISRLTAWVNSIAKRRGIEI